VKLCEWGRIGRGNRSLSLNIRSMEDKGKKSAVMVRDMEIVGETPDNELAIAPRWMVLEPTNNYSNPLRTTVSIDNQDEYPVAFCVRTKERHMPRLNYGYGILKGYESVTLDVIIPPSSDWIKAEENIIGKHHKIVFENLRLPPGITIPDDAQERANMGRQVLPLPSPISTLLLSDIPCHSRHLSLHSTLHQVSSRPSSHLQIEREANQDQ
ncbi:hypothetical protein PENTCL1PPCAC_23033, partial [Pristionchus entomophagus]